MLRLKEQTIRRKIAETGHSVKSWGEKHGFVQGTLSGWITGARNIKLSNLIKLAEALQCEPEDISEIVVYDDSEEHELMLDKEEIKGIFDCLSNKQRKSIINVANLIAEANKDADRAENIAFGEW
jgi:DNA-binding Xre family transcriptional regulator